jgi:exosome complex RNA-binding protein Rrp42 (RNase PH superfamily)
MIFHPWLLTVEGDTQAGDAFVIDATAREEEAAEQACHIAVSPTRSICGLFRGGSAAITPFALQVGEPGL